MTAPVQHPMYIDGQFVSGRGDGWIDVLNPATEALLSRIPDGTAEEARLAIDAAERSQPGWRLTPPSAPSPAGKRCRPLSARAGCAKLPPVSVSVPTRSPG
ncbi:lactaldehyde dehydrogenase [Klebsiella pneumoniae]|nr:lactaldehyde dehydrogenase [Klebsiella pneumoniae]